MPAFQQMKRETEMFTLPRFLSAAAAAICSIAALNSAPAAAQDSIIVQGERIEPADIRRTARDIVIGARAMRRPLSRFQRPICPGAWGLSEEVAQAVLDRIVANAIEADVPVNEDPDCGANIWIIVVDDARETFEQLRDDNSFLTRNLGGSQLDAVRNQEGAALGWNQISERNPETGERLPSSFQFAAAVQAARAAGLATPSNNVTSFSRLELSIRSDIDRSVLLVERAALTNIDTHALGDYATMRLLAQLQPPDRGNNVSTVLEMLAPGDVGESAPQRMTPFDRAILRAVYRSDPRRPARVALGDVYDLMANEAE